MSNRTHIWTCTMSRVGRMYSPVSYNDYNVVLFMISKCEITSTYDELKYLFLKRFLTKTGHSYKQQLIFPLNFQKICHMTYKNRTKEKKQTCAINDRLSPLKWCSFLSMAANSSNSILYFVPTVVWSQLSWGLGAQLFTSSRTLHSVVLS